MNKYVVVRVFTTYMKCQNIRVNAYKTLKDAQNAMIGEYENILGNNMDIVERNIVSPESTYANIHFYDHNGIWGDSYIWTIKDVN